MALSVLLVEDVPELRSILRQTLRLRGDVVAEAADGASAITAAARLQPDVVVLDLGLPDLAGHEVLTRLRAVSPIAQIVVYTGSLSSGPLPFSDEVEAFVTKDRDVAYVADLVGRLSRRHRESAAVELGPDAGDVAVGRRFLNARCREWGCGDLVEDAELVVSELVTNALLHGGTRCQLTVGLTEAALRVQVIDESSHMPDPQSAGHDDEHGRGLLLVSVLCAAWGVEPLPGGGKLVWAEMLRPVRETGGDTPPGRAPSDASASEERSGGPSDFVAGSTDTPPPATSSVAVARS